MSYMNCMKTITLIIVQLLVSTSVVASTYYVSPIGNDTNSGTSELVPFKTVQFVIISRRMNLLI